jgi:hypothetical protein
VQIVRRKGGSRTSHSRSTVRRGRSVARLAAASIVNVGLLLGSSSGAAAASSENASCVEKFNVAVGTPGEFQRVFHQDKLGRDVSFFARLGEDCPFGQRCSREAGRSNGLIRSPSLPRTGSGRLTLRAVIAMDGSGPPSLALIHPTS